MSGSEFQPGTEANKKWHDEHNEPYSDTEAWTEPLPLWSVIAKDIFSPDYLKEDEKDEEHS